MHEADNLYIKDLTFFFPKDTTPFFYKLNSTFLCNSLNFIQGKNGIGKSTFLRIMCGELLPQERVTGTLHVENTTYNFEKSYEIKDAIRMVPQNFNDILLSSYSFSQNLQCALLGKIPKLRGLSPCPAIPPFIKKYGINTEIPISSLSGGQRQILSILMTIQKAPKIMLLDEPTATMDEENARLVINFLAELADRSQITIILVVHQKELIRQYCKNFYHELLKDHAEIRQLVPVLCKNTST